jgi:hypothetical protein
MVTESLKEQMSAYLEHFRLDVCQLEKELGPVRRQELQILREMYVPNGIFWMQHALYTARKHIPR